MTWFHRCPMSFLYERHAFGRSKIISKGISAGHSKNACPYAGASATAMTQVFDAQYFSCKAVRLRYRGLVAFRGNASAGRQVASGRAHAWVDKWNAIQSSGIHSESLEFERIFAGANCTEALSFSRLSRNFIFWELSSMTLMFFSGIFFFSTRMDVNQIDQFEEVLDSMTSSFPVKVFYSEVRVRCRIAIYGYMYM